MLINTKIRLYSKFIILGMARSSGSHRSFSPYHTGSLRGNQSMTNTSTVENAGDSRRASSNVSQVGVSSGFPSFISIIIITFVYISWGWMCISFITEKYYHFKSSSFSLMFIEMANYTVYVNITIFPTFI